MRHPSFLTAAALLLLAPPAGAQQTAAPAEIAVTARGEVEVAPDYAIIVFGVEVRDSTPVLAATEMDRRLAAVADTLADLGFPRDSLPNAGFHIRPLTARPGVVERAPESVASSSVSVTVHEMRRLPELVGAVLAAGATTVGRLTFQPASGREARDRAIERAIRAAERDASRMAAAAGLRLVRILEIRSTGERAPDYTIAMAPVAAGYPGAAPITPRTITVGVTVTVRWEVAP